MFQRIKNYLGGVRHELKQVHWPTRSEAIKLTAIIVVVSAILALFLGAFDLLFAYLLKVFIF